MVVVTRTKRPVVPEPGGPAAAGRNVDQLSAKTGCFPVNRDDLIMLAFTYQISAPGHRRSRVRLQGIDLPSIT